MRGLACEHGVSSPIIREKDWRDDNSSPPIWSRPVNGAGRIRRQAARAFMAAAGGKVSTSELVRWRWRFSDLLATRPTPAWQHCLREDIPNQSAFSIF